MYFLLDRGVCGFGRLSRVWRGDGSSFMECPLYGFPGKLFTYLIGFLLMAGGAFLVHRVNYALMLIREKTLLPFLFYALLTVQTRISFP